MGTTQDMLQRKLAPRVDNDDRKTRITQARSIIYDNRNAVDGKAVEALLKSDSLVPISVSYQLLRLNCC